ncbi:tRNA synthetases class I-domain-containing protein [Amylostereum chailletii]|nr:tRNA synthetases class I-domain-containing protein [Amylostereum chailletii]
MIHNGGVRWHTLRIVSRARRVEHPRPRLASTKASPNPNKQFSKSILLPKTKFPQWTDPTKTEVALRKKTCDELYAWQRENATGPSWVLHDGPPYANGDLHMGHALNKILKDIINRYHVSLGHRVHYVPGWDCHGLPIENKALQEHGDHSTLSPGEIRKLAKSTAYRAIKRQKSQFQDFGIMADWENQALTYRTLDHDYEMRQLDVFKHMVDRGLIYRHYRPVHYSPSSRSALAEAELVYKDDHVSHSVYVAFALDRVSDTANSAWRAILEMHSKVRLLVWTTTPWTLTANMGIAVHPDLTYVLAQPLATSNEGPFIVGKERLSALAHIIGEVSVLAEFKGADLVGAAYRPLFSSLSSESLQPSLRILPSGHVTSDSGTGLVHCAPAHGAEDYNVFRSLDLLGPSSSIICHVGSKGEFTDQVFEVAGTAGKELVGREVLREGSKAVVQLLEKMQVLVKLEKVKHRYPYDWKTDQPILVTATSQWFANLDGIKGDALKALEDVSFYPQGSRNRLESFIKSRSEWCISRQRVWGVPIPSLHDITTDSAVLDRDSLNHILPILKEKGVAYWWEGPVEEFVPPALKDQGKWRKGTDTMDVWFDSGSSWSMLNEREGHRADVCLEGSDQHRGWFQSQLLTAVGVGETTSQNVAKAPYGTLITHGMVLDQAGRKMSKSLGNIMNPTTVVKGGKDTQKEPAHGADTLRLWAATVEYWRDISIGPTILSQTAESLRKIRNTARFILGNLGSSGIGSSDQVVTREEMGLAERFVMSRLYELEHVALEGYATYNFPKVMAALTNFTNITLSSLYFDITKDNLYANSVDSWERKSSITALRHILNTMLHIIAPILPHLAEEINHYTLADSSQNLENSPSVFSRKWLPLSPEWKDVAAEADMTHLLHIRRVVLSLLERARGQRELSSSLEAEVDLVIEGSSRCTPIASLLTREEHFLKTLFIVSDASVTDKGSLETTPHSWCYMESVSLNNIELTVRVRPASREKCPRCWTYTREEEETLCSRCENALAVTVAHGVSP